MEIALSIVGGGVALSGLAALIIRTSLFPYFIAVAAAVPTTAAITIGENSVNAFYLLAIPATGVGAVLWLDRDRRPRSEFAPLWWFFLIGIAATLVGPALFEGIRILLPGGGIDAQVLRPTPLAYNTSMAAQLGYLALGIGTAYYLSQTVVRPRRLLDVTFATGILLSTVKWVFGVVGVPWPTTAFENFARAGYNPFDLRHHGIFSEPSYFAAFVVSAFVFYLLQAQTVPALRLWSIAMALLAAGNLALTGSATGIATFIIASALLGAHASSRFLTEGRPIPLPRALVATLIGILVVANWSLIWDAVLLLQDKYESQSGTSRFTADGFSLRLFWDTYGLGVGVGANRPSSFATMLLSCTGALGTLLFAFAVFRILRGRLTDLGTAPLAWTLVTLLLAKTVAEPDLSTPLLWLTIGLVLAADQTGPTEATPAAPSGSRHTVSHPVS